MKRLNWLILGLLMVGMLGLTNSASAQCTAKLTSGIGPIGETFQAGDTVPYRVTLSVPDDEDACTLVNLTVYYFPPPLGIDAFGSYPTPCEAVADGHGTVIGTIAVMNPGDPESQWDFPYVVTGDDALAGSIKGEMAVTFYAQGSDIERCDQKTGENFVACPEPCVLITKTVDCDISKVGDEVIYTICVENCGQSELTDIEVTDPHLGGVLAGFPSTLAAGGSECVDFPYTIEPGDDSGMPGATVENQASVTAIDGCDGETVVTDDSEIVVVNLIHPAMEVTKTCLTDPAPRDGDADFEVTITNTGDVALNYTTDDAEIGPGSLNPGESYTQVVSVPVPPGAEEVCNEITVTWTIGGDNPCELDNTGDVVADDCCSVPGAQGRWTGGGTIDFEAVIPEGASVTHGFEFHCDLREPNNLEVNWSGGNKFHMTELLSADCYMNTSMPPPDPPVAPLNEVFASGIGRYNNVDGYTVDFHFTDVGEPGVDDYAQIVVRAPDATVVLDVEGTLHKGNHQAHRDNKAEIPIDGVQDTGILLDGKTGGIALDNGGSANAAQFSFGTPEKFIVKQSVPNPFSQTVKIEYGLPKAGPVDIVVFDAAGRRVASLVNDQKPAGFHSVIWDGRNNQGSRVPTGIYFYTVKFDGNNIVKKMMMVD